MIKSTPFCASCAGHILVRGMHFFVSLLLMWLFDAHTIFLAKDKSYLFYEILMEHAAVTFTLTDLGGHSAVHDQMQFANE